MDTVLQGIPFVICYLDDILVTGRSEEEHRKNLEEVLSRLQRHGIRLKKEKCRFFSKSVEYLGHVINAEGVHTSPTKVKAIIEAPPPRNLQELRSFLGLINYYAKFISNLSSSLHPLHALLKVGQSWKWTGDCEEAFQLAKLSLIAAPVLAHYDPSIPLVVATDASAYGVGAVLSHRYPDGSERPIAYASRTLSSSEHNYAQVEKEALSLVFGVQKFHQYLYGRHFSLQTDHKPLTTILGPKTGIPPLAAARMQRWALLLSAYHYDIAFKLTKAHANADGLSRLPLPDSTAVGNHPDPTIFNMVQLSSLPVTATEVTVATRTDPVLGKLLKCLRQGWPQSVPEELIPFHRRRDELTVEGDSVLWGHRVVIPTKLQRKVLEELHQGHPGVVRMKAIARSHVWWPRLDKRIEEQSKSCIACQSTRNIPAKAPLHPWAWCATPWERVHIDFAGPFLGKMLFVAIDTHSKWPEVAAMTTTTTSKTIAVLREVFARNGIPRQIVSDNGPQFTSDEFSYFMKSNGIRHIRTSPYHPSSNGAAERFVQTVKKTLLAEHRTGIPLERAIATFLLRYRTTPYATTGVTPASLFVGRELRTRLHLLTPELGSRVREKQLEQKLHHDRHAQRRELVPGQNVWARNFCGDPNWVEAIVTDRIGSLTYLVQGPSGDLWRRHIDHLRIGVSKPTSQPSDDQSENADLTSHQKTPSGSAEEICGPDPIPVTTGESASSAATDVESRLPPLNETPRSDAAGTSITATPTAVRRYPARSRKPPDRLYNAKTN